MDSKPMSNEDEQDQNDILDLANKFIALANKMVNLKRAEGFWKIGTALRYAAARYSSHEAGVASENLLKERDEMESWFASQFKTMLIENMQQEIESLKNEDKKNATNQSSIKGLNSGSSQDKMVF